MDYEAFRAVADRTCMAYLEGPDRGAAGLFHISGEISPAPRETSEVR
jgi:hypothetical protein